MKDIYNTLIIKELIPDLKDEAFENNIYRNVYFPDWDNRPKDQPAVLSLNGVSVLSHQNTSAIIAAPGFGKSSICEAVAANFLNPTADCLGWKVHGDCYPIVIDTERTNTDVWNTFNRMHDRAGAGSTNKVVIAGLRAIPRLNERLKAITNLLQENPCGLLILDGAGDMVTDTNDLGQAVECRIFLRELTTVYNLSILTTLHPNHGNLKPRGHIGSEICREAECVLLVKNYGPGFKLITTEFEGGKNRNSSHANAAFTWSDEAHMFVSVDASDCRQNAKDLDKRDNVQSIADKIFSTIDCLKHTELISKIVQVVKVSDSTAKRRLEDMLAWDIVYKGNNGSYYLSL